MSSDWPISLYIPRTIGLGLGLRVGGRKYPARPDGTGPRAGREGGVTVVRTRTLGELAGGSLGVPTVRGPLGASEGTLSKPLRYKHTYTIISTLNIVFTVANSCSIL